MDRRVSEWTRNHTPYEVMQKMQEKDVPAGVVQSSEDLFNDPQLKERSHFIPLNHTEMGTHMYQSAPFTLSKTPPSLERAAPCIGEHNTYFLRSFLVLPKTR